MARALFQSTSPVWGMTKIDALVIHAFSISIHIPRVGDDNMRKSCNSKAKIKFQSTSPVWGMTRNGGKYGKRLRYFNPHPPCGG